MGRTSAAGLDLDCLVDEFSSLLLVEKELFVGLLSPIGEHSRFDQGAEVSFCPEFGAGAVNKRRQRGLQIPARVTE